MSSASLSRDVSCRKETLDPSFEQPPLEVRWVGADTVYLRRLTIRAGAFAFEVLARFQPVNHVAPVITEVLAHLLPQFAGPAGNALWVVFVEVAEARRVSQILQLGVFALQLKHA